MVDREEAEGGGVVDLNGLPVGLVATAFGWQATGGTLLAMRSIVHALRGWPTPFGAAINTSAGPFREGCCADPRIAEQIALVGTQVVEFARVRGTARSAHRPDHRTDGGDILCRPQTLPDARPRHRAG